MAIRTGTRKNINITPLDSVGAAGSFSKKLYAIDALQKRTIQQLKDFKTWAGNSSIFIGEFGTHKSDAAYIENERLFIESMNAIGIPATYWAAGQFWGNYNLIAYEFNGTDIIDTPISRFIENNESNLRGVNLAGAEFGIAPTANGYHNTNLGTAGSTYFWATTAYIKNIVQRGHKVVRVPFTWERMQPTLGGALDTTYLNSLKTVVDYLRANNAIAVLDVHNYGAYRTSSGAFKIGSGTVTQAHFNDLWTRLNTEFNSYENTWFGLMNEPSNLTHAEWETVSQSTVTALRSAGCARKIIVALGNYSGIHQISSHVTGPWITGGGDIMYEGHSYHDGDFSGDYSESYASSVTTASGQGFAAGYVDIGEDTVKAKTILGNSLKIVNETGQQIAAVDTDGDLDISGDYYIDGAKVMDTASSMYVPDTLAFAGTARVDTGYTDTSTQAITVAVGDVVICAIAGCKLVNLTSVTANGNAMTAPVAHQSMLNVTGAVIYYWVSNVAGSIDVVVNSAGNFDQKTFLITKVAGLNTASLLLSSYGNVDFYTSHNRTFTMGVGDVLFEMFASQGGGVFTTPSGSTVLTNADHSDANMGATAVTYIVADTTTESSLITPATSDNVARISLVFRRSLKLNYLPKNNTTPYTPTAQYHPATKGYVDGIAGVTPESVIAYAVSL